MGLHVGQMTSQGGIRACFEAVTTNAAKVMHLEAYGIASGRAASFVLLQASDVLEAIRVRSNRLKVWRAGRLIAETPELVSRLAVGNRPETITFDLPLGDRDS